MSDSPGTSSSPAMLAIPLISDSQQMHNHQQIPNDPPIPDLGPRHGYPPAHVHPSTHGYCPAHCHPPSPGYPRTFHHPSMPGYPQSHSYPYMAPDHHLFAMHEEYDLAPPLPFPSAPGMAGRVPQSNAELSNLPIPQGPPPKYQGTSAPHSTLAQTPTNNPPQSHFPPTGNVDHKKTNKDIQSPNIEPSADDPEREIIIAVMGLTGNSQRRPRVAVY